jgi:iron-sulfur cluster assembly protein
MGDNVVLLLTETAESAIRDLTDRPGLPEGSGLRIAIAPTPGELQLSVHPGAPGDEMVEQNGARVYLEPTAAELLSDQLLDAQVSDAGTGFVLSAQA